MLVVQRVFRAKRTNLHEKYDYPYMHAFRIAARALAGSELADMLEHDLHALQDRAFDQLGDDRARLHQRYAEVDHPMAAEVVHWLDGADTVDRWVEDA